MIYKSGLGSSTHAWSFYFFRAPAQTSVCPFWNHPLEKKLEFSKELTKNFQVFFSRGLSAIMTKPRVSEGTPWPQLFTSVKWESLFFWRTSQRHPRMQMKNCIQVSLKLIRTSIRKCPQNLQPEQFFLRTSFWVWNQKNLLKRFYWMPGAGRAKIFSTHFAPKLY